MILLNRGKDEARIDKIGNLQELQSISVDPTKESKLKGFDLVFKFDRGDENRFWLCEKKEHAEKAMVYINKIISEQKSPSLVINFDAIVAAMGVRSSKEIPFKIMSASHKK